MSSSSLIGLVFQWNFVSWKKKIASGNLTLPITFRTRIRPIAKSDHSSNPWLFIFKNSWPKRHLRIQMKFSMSLFFYILPTLLKHLLLHFHFLNVTVFSFKKLYLLHRWIKIIRISCITEIKRLYWCKTSVQDPPNCWKNS